MNTIISDLSRIDKIVCRKLTVWQETRGEANKPNLRVGPAKLNCWNK